MLERRPRSSSSTLTDVPCPQGTQVYIFLTKAGYTLVDNYPKQLEKELGSPHGISLDAVDATFVCPGTSRLHVMAGEGRRVLWVACPPWPRSPRGVSRWAAS